MWRGVSVLADRVIHVVRRLRPGGGPAGYLCNLAEVLKSSGRDSSMIGIATLADREKRMSLVMRSVREIRRLFVSLRPDAGLNHELDKWNGGKVDYDTAAMEQILSSRIVISHSLVFTISYLRYPRRPAGQRLYVFNHSPIDTTSETIEDWTFKLNRQVSELDQYRARLTEIELGVYEAADGVIAPCRESLDGYFAGHPAARERFDRVLSSKELHEIPTGVPELMCPDGWMSRKRELFGDKTVVGYFGRYHPQKGFDIFCELVRLFRDNKKFHFVSAGKSFLDAPTDLANYADFGMLDKQTKLPEHMRMCDVVVVPNRNTYFDLVSLEAMSLGLPVVTSATGGNIFLGRKSPGVLLIERLNAVSLREAILARSSDSFEKLGTLNRKAYEEEFSLDRFVDRHIRLADELLGNHVRPAYNGGSI
jgi:glycosyltransferase involved in cell wall biosynthesis